MRANLLIAALFLGLSAACARTVPIKEIVEHPRDYAGKQVTISGEVTDAFSLLAFKYFMVSDGTGRIAVFSEKPLPKRGERIKVTGQVEEAFSLGTETLTVLIEEGSQPKAAK
ncbi:MAG TPA: OB-fold nucleic acid binding domain-containing protein [Burkholderiales bacterium]|nr:OB-fold nucleic acid binding domain-containing protein [Burkholderiales bacterium]